MLRPLRFLFIPVVSVSNAIILFILSDSGVGHNFICLTCVF